MYIPKITFVIFILIIGLDPDLQIFRAFLNLTSISVLFSSIILSYNSLRNSIYLLVFINIAFILTKFLFVSNTNFILFCLLMLFLYLNIFNSTSSQNKIKFISQILILLTLTNLFFKFLLNNVAGLLTILGLGYDNSHHMSLFRHYFKSSESDSFSLARYESIPESLFASYPNIFHVFFGSIYRLVGFNSTNEQLIVSYSFSIFLLFLFQVFGIANILIQLKKSFNFTSSLKSWATIFILTLTFLIISQYSIMFISGYPHNIFGLVILILLIWQLLIHQSKTYYWALVGLVLIPISYSVPQQLPLVVGVIIYIFFLSLRDINKKSFSISNRFVLFIALMAPVSIAITGVSSIIKRFSLNQIYAEGGIEPFPFYFYLLYIGAFFILVNYLKVFHYQSLNDRSKQTIFLVISIAALSQITAFFLSLLTYLQLNYVSYYALKSIYFSLPFIFIALMTVSLLPNNHFRNYQWSLTRLFSFTFLSCLVFMGFFPKVYQGGFMSSIPIATNRFIDSETKGAQLIYGPQMLSALKTISYEPSTSVFIIASDTHGSDLNSRWLNAVNGTFSDSNWTFFYNSSLQSINENCKSKSKNQFIFADISTDYSFLLSNCISFQKVIAFDRSIDFRY